MNLLYNSHQQTKTLQDSLSLLLGKLFGQPLFTQPLLLQNILIAGLAVI
jgi:hypothetical protein